MKFVLILLYSFSLFAKQPHPVAKVDAWFKEEKERTEGRFFKFASLATVASNGRPHARMIEITNFNQTKGALFFTHEKTEKISHLSYNPHASLNIYLPRTHRQLCIDGIVNQISREEAEKAWSRMPRFMKFTFMASNNGELLESQTILENRRKELEKEYPKEVLCPQEFKGYRLVPDRIIFFKVHHRSFPTKEIATLEQNEWIYTAVEP